MPATETNPVELEEDPLSLPPNSQVLAGDDPCGHESQTDYDADCQQIERYLQLLLGLAAQAEVSNAVRRKV